MTFGELDLWRSGRKAVVKRAMEVTFVLKVELNAPWSEVREEKDTISELRVEGRGERVMAMAALLIRTNGGLVRLFIDCREQLFM